VRDRRHRPGPGSGRPDAADRGRAGLPDGHGYPDHPDGDYRTANKDSIVRSAAYYRLVDGVRQGKRSPGVRRLDLALRPGTARSIQDRCHSSPTTGRQCRNPSANACTSHHTVPSISPTPYTTSPGSPHQRASNNRHGDDLTATATQGPPRPARMLSGTERMPRVTRRRPPQPPLLQPFRRLGQIRADRRIRVP
jgi:hypothetical protein